MITEQTIIDKIEILSSGVIQVRRADQVLKDGVVIASRFHRHCIAPGQDYLGEADDVKAVCSLIHTEAKISEYQASIQQAPAQVEPESE